jgi:hypothetical protein
MPGVNRCGQSTLTSSVAVVCMSCLATSIGWYMSTDSRMTLCTGMRERKPETVKNEICCGRDDGHSHQLAASHIHVNRLQKVALYRRIRVAMHWCEKELDRMGLACKVGDQTCNNGLSMPGHLVSHILVYLRFVTVRPILTHLRANIVYSGRSA